MEISRFFMFEFGEFKADFILRLDYYFSGLVYIPDFAIFFNRKTGRNREGVFPYEKKVKENKKHKIKMNDLFK